MGKGKLYRSPNGKIMGVCQGIANWLQMDVSLVRLAVIIAACITGGVVCFAYIGLGIFLPVDGHRNYSRESNTRSEYKKRQSYSVNDVKEEFENIKSRISKMENSVFDKEKDWDERFKK